MKTLAMITIAAALAASPVSFAAEDDKSPGKASDAVKEPAAPAATKPESGAAGGADAGRRPGKESDTVREPTGKESEKKASGDKEGAKFSGKITSVDKAAKTITINDKERGTHTLHVDADTKMLPGNAKADWDHLKVGDQVNGMCKKQGDRTHALSLELGS